MREKVRAFMEQYHMVTAGERVLLGLSGGADSVCLFHLLRELQEPLGFSLLAVHVNHNLRGAEAGRDAAFAENLCREYDVPFYLYSCPVEKIAKEKHLSTEEAGRAARQEVFAACAKEQGAVKIALAHHQDDVAETMLHHLARGTSLAGLASLRPVRGNVIRPLLCVGRKEIRQELESRKCSWCEDSTNAEDAYTRQSGLIEELKSTIVFEPEFRDANALRGLEEYSHLWLIWEFSEAVRDTWSPMVRPPRLGGNKRVGVFATRSPFRPNPIGLSSVKLEYVEQHPSLGPVLHLTGADLMDGTPILDIKPYLPHVDSHVEALGSFTEKTKEYFIPVEIPDELLEKVPTDHRAALKKVLEQDPRPSYQNSEERVYGLSFAGMEIKFQVKDEVLHVVGVEM